MDITRAGYEVLVNKDLVVICGNYIGKCNSCNYEIKFDRLLLADTLKMDDFGNKIYYCIGVPDYLGTTVGTRAICENCGITMKWILIYENKNISKEVTEWLNHSCLS